MDLRDAHLGLQVEDLDRACTLLDELFGLTFAEPITGSPIDEDGRCRHTSHEVDGLRVEMTGAGARGAFERWAVTGVAEGASAAFERGRGDVAPQQDEAHA